MSERITDAVRSELLSQGAAIGWDAAVAAMRYEDGSPVEIAFMVNPYRPRTHADAAG